MDPLISAALVGGVAQLGGGFMSAQGASNANAANESINKQNLMFQNNVNAASWEHQQAVNAENWAHSLQTLGFNQDFAREQTNSAYGFNSQQALAQRDWQERMSNTAYQRATADMRAAGINPMLAYMKGGADTGSGGMASASAQGTQGSGSTSGNAPISGASQNLSMQNTQDEMGRAVGRVVSSAIDAYKNGEQAKLMGEEQELTKQKKLESKSTENLLIVKQLREMEETRRTQEETENAREQRNVIKAMVGNVNAHSAAHHASARRNSAEANFTELKNREAKPVKDGGYGRGTGVGPIYPERLMRNFQDSLTDWGIN